MSDHSYSDFVSNSDLISGSDIVRCHSCSSVVSCPRVCPVDHELDRHCIQPAEQLNRNRRCGRYRYDGDYCLERCAIPNRARRNAAAHGSTATNSGPAHCCLAIRIRPPIHSSSNACVGPHGPPSHFQPPPPTQNNQAFCILFRCFPSLLLAVLVSPTLDLSAQP
jgi:hypothetical protein